MQGGSLNGLDFQVTAEFTKKDYGEGEKKETHYCGVASSISLDRDEERMSEKALDSFAKGLVKNSTVFFNHDHKALGVGKITKAYVEGKELKVEFKPTKAKSMEDVVMQIDEGILRCMSIGGRVLDSEEVFEKDLGKKIRVIKDVEGLEVSVVGIGANPDASIVGAIAKAYKGFKPMTNEIETPTVEKAGPGELKKENGPQTSMEPSLMERIKILEGSVAELRGKLAQGTQATVMGKEETRGPENPQTKATNDQEMALKALAPVLTKFMTEVNSKLDHALNARPLAKSRALVSEDLFLQNPDSNNPYSQRMKQLVDGE